MTKIINILMLFFAMACGEQSSPKKSTSPISQVKLLADKANLYSNLVQSEGHQDEHGFIMTEACDSLLFSGLLSAARSNLNIDILAAQDNLGAWHRRPGHDCGKELGNSRSTISRDMMIGLFWHLYKNKDLDTAVELMDSLKDNFYMLKGQGTPGELFMLPTFMATLAEIIYSLSDKEIDYTTERFFPVSFGTEGGFVAHLNVWHILLRGEILGYLTLDELDVIEHHKINNPKNPLFQAAYHKYADGNQSEAIKLLLDNDEWPSNKLPTNKEHCSEWPIEREYTEKDWGPCEIEKEHTGAELVIIYELIIKQAA